MAFFFSFWPPIIYFTISPGNVFQGLANLKARKCFLISRLFFCNLTYIHCNPKEQQFPFFADVAIPESCLLSAFFSLGQQACVFHFCLTSYLLESHLSSAYSQIISNLTASFLGCSSTKLTQNPSQGFPMQSWKRSYFRYYLGSSFLCYFTIIFQQYVTADI